MHYKWVQVRTKVFDHYYLLPSKPRIFLHLVPGKSQTLHLLVRIATRIFRPPQSCLPYFIPNPHRHHQQPRHLPTPCLRNPSSSFHPSRSFAHGLCNFPFYSTGTL